MSVTIKWGQCMAALHEAASEAWESEMVATLMVELELEDSDLTLDEFRKEWIEDRIEEWYERVAVAQ